MNSTEAKNRLLELAQLPHDWDSYGSCSIAPQAIATATKLLDTLQPVREVDFIAPLNGGGIQLEYKSSLHYLEIEIHESGAAVSVFCTVRSVVADNVGDIINALQSM